MRYTTGGQDAHPTRVLLLKFVPYSNGICCMSIIPSIIKFDLSVIVQRITSYDRKRTGIWLWLRQNERTSGSF
ncbi:MAG: hypothetical protein ACKO87_11645 [Dolichospermum sp.]